jgi:hypothetical protein
MSKKLDATINALVHLLATLPEHELEEWQRGNRLGLRILSEFGRRYPGNVSASGSVTSFGRDRANSRWVGAPTPSIGAHGA